MPHPDCFSITVPPQARYLKPLRAFSSSLLADRCSPDADLLVLALDECCSNIIKYRCASLGENQIQVYIEIQDDCVVFRIGSFCKTDDLPMIKSRHPREDRPGGLGIHLIAEIMDRVAFEPEPGRPECMALILEKRFHTKNSPDE